jgi:peptidase YpeB-like protein
MLARCAAGLASVILFVTACAHLRATELSRDRAITIARTQVRFDPFDVTADRRRSSGGTVWRVVLKGRLPGQPPMLFETAVVEIDATTGTVLSVGKT